MTRQVAIRLPDETFHRLQHLAQKTGRTTTWYMREAIQQHLEDLEDIYLSELSLEKLKSGKDSVISSQEFWRDWEN